jgi:hypothetical protein
MDVPGMVLDIDSVYKRCRVIGTICNINANISISERNFNLGPFKPSCLLSPNFV